MSAANSKVDHKIRTIVIGLDLLFIFLIVSHSIFKTHHFP